MIGLVKLTRNGNGTTVTIPRPLLRFLGWAPADDIAVVANEDKSLTLFRVTREEILASHQRTLLPEQTETAQL